MYLLLAVKRTGGWMGVVVRRLSILTVAALVLSQLNWEGKYMTRLPDDRWLVVDICGKGVEQWCVPQVDQLLDTQLPPVDCKV